MNLTPNMQHYGHFPLPQKLLFLFGQCILSDWNLVFGEQFSRVQKKILSFKHLSGLSEVSTSNKVYLNKHFTTFQV